MNEILSIAKTFFAYLVRPRLWPEFSRKIHKNIFDRKSPFKGKEEAIVWCNSLGISQEEAIRSVLKIENHVPVNELFEETLKNAKKAEASCPIKMGGAGALDMIFYLNEFVNAKNSLETGVAYGWSSLATLLSLNKRNGTLYSSDMPYLAQNGDQYVGCVVPAYLSNNWKLFRSADKESLPQIFKEQAVFDFAHYDSDKSYNGRIWAYNVLWNHIREGGVLMSDDISDNAAFKDFCTSKNLKPTVVGFDDKFAGFIIK